MTAIEIQGLARRFGATRALDGLDLCVPDGSVFGFVGPNGAGKTTTIRILLGLARADAGRASVLGTDVLANPAAVASRLGYLPDVPAFYPWMRAPEYLEFCASAFRLDRPAHRIGMLLDLVNLNGVSTRIGGFSRGMKQRLGIAQALINSPELLILDEPTSALDPVGRRDLLQLIERLRGQTTVFFSTHILSDVERVCDEIAVLAQGRAVATGTPAELRARFSGGPRLRLSLVEDAADLLEPLASESWVRGTSRMPDGGWLIDATDLDLASHRMPQILAERGWGLRSAEILEPSLEDVFVRIVSGQEAAL